MLTPRKSAMMTLALSAGVLSTACAENRAPSGAGTVEDASIASAVSNPHAPGGEIPLSTATGGGSTGGGVVQERVNGGGYTYTRLATAGGEIWAAGPQSELAVGDVVSLAGATPMEDFPSKTLNRTFDLLYFLGVYEVLDSGGAGGAAVASGEALGSVLTVFHAAGYTYLEVEQKDAVTWVAAPQATVSEGDPVTWQGGTTMYGFSSRSLDRTFEEILFVEGVQVVR